MKGTAVQGAYWVEAVRQSHSFVHSLGKMSLSICATQTENHGDKGKKFPALMELKTRTIKYIAKFQTVISEIQQGKRAGTHDDI